MIPQGSIFNSNPSIQATQQPSRTYRIDPITKRIVGMTDGLEAMKQAVMKILQTERFDFLIYSGSHGSELAALPGNGTAYIQTELGRRIRTALLQDDRISDVQDMQVTGAGDEAVATFTVITQYGNFKMTKGV